MLFNSTQSYATVLLHIFILIHIADVLSRMTYNWMNNQLVEQIQAKGLAQGLNGEITLPTLGFEPTTLRSQAPY